MPRNGLYRYEINIVMLLQPRIGSLQKCTKITKQSIKIYNKNMIMFITIILKCWCDNSSLQSRSKIQLHNLRSKADLSTASF